MRSRPSLAASDVNITPNVTSCAPLSSSFSSKLARFALAAAEIRSSNTLISRSELPDSSGLGIAPI